MSDRDTVYITATDISSAVYCEKKWQLAGEAEKLSSEELVKRINALRSKGKESTLEFEQLSRRLAAQERMDAGTTAHTKHGVDAFAGRQMSLAAKLLLILAAAILLAVLFLL